MCGDRTEVVAKLEGIYGETQRVRGLTDGGQIMEWFASDSGTWTLLISHANGITCAIAIGEHWQAVPPMPINGAA